jgi:bifunctional aspartokinase / homoserine dehydrogenase 1
MIVLKFGGSSIGTPERIDNVIKILSSYLDKKKKIAVVISAFHGITDALIKMSELAAIGNPDYLVRFKELEARHLKAIKELISIKSQSKALSTTKLTLNELEDVLNGVFLIKELSPKTADFIMSFGERLSAYIISQTLIDRNYNAEFLDSRQLVKTDNNFGNAHVLFPITNKNIRNYFKTHNKLQVITGFIGSTLKNETTTLGRGGSDFSVSIFGSALNSEEIEIWTDVDGVLTTDPKKVKKAFPLKSLSYEEAMELSHFGAKVIHPPTMQPALDKRIPIRIKNTFNPSFPGTLVSKKSESNNFLIKGISSIDNIALIRVQGSGMIGVAGIAQRIFSALAANKISIILITQASSEHSLCFAVLPHHASLARQAIENELRLEINDKLINKILVEDNLSIIAVVGENMRQTPGISGRVFQALGKNGVNIAAIAQGSSELNISTVIRRADESKALNALHDAFFLSSIKSINIYLVGTGLIGSTLLEQIKNQKEYLSQEYHLNIKVNAMANSRKMIFNQHGLNISEWKTLFNESKKKTNLNKFIETMTEINLPNSIFIDCTASEEVVAKYPEILNSSISVVTPNKKANAKNLAFYQKLRKNALNHNVKFLYETNVGAGLPIINTISDLVSSGDEVEKIEGVLSGTLSYIFNSFKDGKSFSETIVEAKKKGYTEPDPREDLNGMDVARKLLILAREVGLELELKNIKVQNLIPPPARKTKSVDEFFKILKKFDSQFEEKRREAEKKGKVLRYIAKLENKKAEISLEEVDEKHPFFSLTGSDNILSITTRHYHERPIVIKGPGAGADVTAAGVFADILRISHYLS